MIQDQVPGGEETFDLLTFLSGYGFWMLLAIALVGVVLYKRFKK